eukprot:gb/GFBE01020907.1/.p1 GENE.gb/GFBE01020907.1/~~gb/GFBE01020907.1/.p1  ORF type:complete len:215 (+),score=26.63 gb/GFBE01020907.1/:1-645(+)
MKYTGGAGALALGAVACAMLTWSADETAQAAVVPTGTEGDDSIVSLLQVAGTKPTPVPAHVAGRPGSQIIAIASSSGSDGGEVLPAGESGGHVPEPMRQHEDWSPALALLSAQTWQNALQRLQEQPVTASEGLLVSMVLISAIIGIGACLAAVLPMPTATRRREHWAEGSDANGAASAGVHGVAGMAPDALFPAAVDGSAGIATTARPRLWACC